MLNDRADQARKILARLRHLGWQPVKDGYITRIYPDGPRLTHELISAAVYGVDGPLGRDVIPMTQACADVATLLRGEAELAEVTA